MNLHCGEAVEVVLLWNSGGEFLVQILLQSAMFPLLCNVLPRPDLTKFKISDVSEPLTVREALDGPFGGHWHDAMLAEHEQMIKFDTWCLVPLPSDRKAIASKWVFSAKPSLTGDGSVKKLKARIVIKGFSQRAGIDYLRDVCTGCSQSIPPGTHCYCGPTRLKFASN